MLHNPILTVNTNLGRIPVELFADKTPITVNNFLNYVNDGDYTNSFFHRFVPNFVLQGGGFKTSTISFADPTVANSFTTVAADAQIQNEFDNYAKVTGTDASITTGNTLINRGTNVDLSRAIVGDRIRLIGRTDGIGGTNMFDITAVNDAADTVTVQTAPTGAAASNVTWAVFPRVNVIGTLAMAKLGGNPNSATNNFFINLGDNDSSLDLQNGGFTVFGQILDQSILTDIAGLNDLSLFNASLTGAQEVPPVTTGAAGSATLALNNKNNQFDLTLNVQGLTANSLTASHIHTGAVGFDGPNVFDLGAGAQYTANGNQLQRRIDNGAFPGASLNSLFQSQTYVNVHTTANPDGEIRGQLTAIQGGLYSDLPTTTTDQLLVIQSITGEGVVRGTVFTDTDNDSVRDQSEAGRHGFTVFDDANSNGTFDAGESSATTDATGAYALRLFSGQHKIRLVPTNGFAKTLPADAYDVTVQIGRDVTGRDFGVLQVPTLTGLDLLPATDSGTSSTDNLTNFNNSSPARALQFFVSGAVDGALVRIFADGAVIGQSTVAAGSNGNVTVTTNGTTTLSDGIRSIIATQELRGVQSTPTENLGVTIDSLVPQFTSIPPTTANVGTPLNYNVENPEEGQANFVYALLSPPAGAVINASTGTVAWTPTDAQAGVQLFQVSATDTAGNVNTQSISVAVTRNAQMRFNLQTTDTNGNPITQISVGGTFQLRATVEDIRTTGARNGVFAAYEDVVFDGNLATATRIVHSPTYGGRTSGTISSGLIDEIGSYAPLITPLGPNPQLLYTITLTATRTGTLTFTGNQPDIVPLHNIGLYGQNTSLPPDEVTYGMVNLAIVVLPEWQNPRDHHDVNDDGSVVPIDVLIVMNELNDLEHSDVATGKLGNRMDSTLPYFDVNGDDYVTPQDALNVINLLNASDSSDLLALSFQNGAFPSTSYAGTRDTKIRGDQPTSVLGTSSKLEIDGKPDIATLLQWDIRQIPARSSIQSASMTINVVDTSGDLFSLYELLQPWEENTASYNAFAAGKPWQKAGAQGLSDRGTTVLGTVTAPQLGAVTIQLNSAGVAVVQAWVDDPSSNHGLTFQNYADPSTDDLDFSSREHESAPLRPKLTVQYAPATIPVSTSVQPSRSLGTNPDNPLPAVDGEGEASGVGLGVSMRRPNVLVRGSADAFTIAPLLPGASEPANIWDQDRTRRTNATGGSVTASLSLAAPTIADRDTVFAESYDLALGRLSNREEVCTWELQELFDTIIEDLAHNSTT